MTHQIVFVKAVVFTEKLNIKLKPFTTFISKPTLPLEEKPILEHRIDWKSKIVINYITKKHIKNIFKNYVRSGNQNE